jgi:hypothetical protein
MDGHDISISWSAAFKVAPALPGKTLFGDKILLPQSALEQLLSASTVNVPAERRPNAHFDPFNPYSLAAARAEQAQWQDTKQQLPHPLTFRLVNSQNGNVVHAGIREFSAEDGEIGLSPFLLEALGLKEPLARRELSKRGSFEEPIDLTEDTDVTIDPMSKETEIPQITVHARQLPKGTYVRLRPLEAGYNPEDWKALLERHLRENFTTLTNGEILNVSAGKEEFRFLIDKFVPEGDGICVVDTDLEVDIEALNEEQARETLKQIMTKAQKAPGTAEGSSIGGEIDIWKAATGQILEGDYVDFEITSWPKSDAVEIELSDNGGDLDIFVSPHAPRQRARPRDDEHVWSDFSNESTKTFTIQPTNVELEDAEALFISINYRKSANPSPAPVKFSLRVKAVPIEAKIVGGNKPIVIDGEDDTEMHTSDEEKCKNCHQYVPKRSMVLHENFCLRNNVLCPHCQRVFQKKSQEWADHWHCLHDLAHGNTPASQAKHDEVSHTTRQCPNCPYEGLNLKDLAMHRTSICPGKLILCQFCHLEVAQEGDPFDPSADQLISGLTAHELADGARTTDCHLCSKIVRLRDMSTHLKNHEFEKSSKVKPSICRNVNCGRTLDGVGKNGEIGAGSRMGQGPGNEIGLCSICFGPLYVSMHDPEGRALKRRVERRYISQLITGCGKAWCTNEYCKTAQARLERATGVSSSKDAVPLVKPFVDAMWDLGSEMYFCTDDGSQKRRKLAEMLAGEAQYELEWCVAAAEAEGGNLDAARKWLNNWAPKRA